MRAVKTNAFLWAAVVVVIGLNEHLALWAAIAGFLLAVVPALFAPKIVPEKNHEHGHHAGTLYRLEQLGQPKVPEAPKPDGLSSYTNGGWS